MAQPQPPSRTFCDGCMLLRSRRFSGICCSARRFLETEAGNRLWLCCQNFVMKETTVGGREEAAGSVQEAWVKADGAAVDSSAPTDGS